jgi:hypothetical protein
MKITKSQKKVGKVMGEFKEGTLHSGKGGKVVKNPKQAVAIALSEAGKARRNEMKTGLYSNINAKQARIKAGSGEKMRKVGSKGAPTADAFKQAAKTAKKTKKVK